MDTSSAPQKGQVGPPAIAGLRRFDDSLGASRLGDAVLWGKRNVAITKLIDGRQVYAVRGHEIDMFGADTPAEPYPGVAVEMEWNNKDPFFDRDLVNFQALHREGVIAAGVIVTRGPRLQHLISGLIRSRDGGFKYGQSSTHWNKLVPRVNLGGGGSARCSWSASSPNASRALSSSGGRGPFSTAPTPFKRTGGLPLRDTAMQSRRSTVVAVRHSTSFRRSGTCPSEKTSDTLDIGDPAAQRLRRPPGPS